MFRFLPLVLALLLAPSVLLAETLAVGNFSRHTDPGRFPAGWEPLEFEKIPKHTRYQLLPDENGVPVIRAEANGSASGVVRALDVDTREFPLLQWRWKAESLLEKGNVREKSGDDYPARIYVTFAYDPGWLSFSERLQFKAAKLVYGEYPPVAALTYVWASRAEKGLEISNAYTDRVKMIVLQSGAGNLGTWQTEKRNIREDFIRLFGKEPPRISGIAIMTDGDNTGESAVAWYGDIALEN